MIKLKKVQFRKCFSGFVLLLFLGGPVLASNIVTILPATQTNSNTSNLVIAEQGNITAKLQFELSTLPKGATIISCKLSLVMAEAPSKRASILVQAITNNILTDSMELSGQLGSITVNPDDNPKDSNLLITSTQNNNPGLKDELIKAYGATKKHFSLLLQTTIPDARVEAYSLNAPKAGWTPRLIVEYVLQDGEPILDWAGSHSDAQHTSRTNNRFFGASVDTVSVKPLLSLENIHRDLVMYKDLLYVIAGPPTFNYLYAVDPYSNTVVWPSSSPGKEGEYSAQVMPVIDPFGRLYYMTDVDSVICFNLEDNYARTPAFTIDTTGNKIAAALTTGRDGRIYVPTLDYIAAYSPFPQHKLLWKYEFNNTAKGVASLVLSPDNDVVYAVTENGSDDSIYAIDAIDGRRLASSSAINVESKDRHNSLTIPVVDPGGQIYVNNSLLDGNSIFVFDRMLTTIDTITGEHLSKPVVSRVTEDSKIPPYVLYAKNNELYKYSENKETIIPGTQLQLGNEINLLTDNGGNVYCMNKSPFNFQSFDLEGKPLNLNLNSGNGYTLDKGVIISPDGSIYSATSTGLVAIRPTSFRENDAYTFRPDSPFGTYRARQMTIGALDTSAVYNHTLIGSETVTFSGNPLGSSSTLKVIAGNTISFQNGFRVQKGAKLTCKTGY